MLRLTWFFIYLLKYLVVTAIITLIAGMIFPPAGAVVLVLFLIGSLAASWKDAGEKVAAVKFNRLVKKSTFELEGFDQALKQTLRSMR